MKRSRYELERFQLPYSNNWLKLHRYAMIRISGVRRRPTHFELVNLPFPDLVRKKKRFKQAIQKGFDKYEIK